MALAHSLEQYLHHHHAHYELIRHPHTVSAARTAQVAHVPGEKLAKAVVLGDGEQFMLVIIPSTHQVDLGRLHHHTGHLTGLVTETDLNDLFTDCDPGAVPALGAAYGLKTLVDEAVLRQPDIYFEAGDHEHLVHMNEDEFEQLLEGAERGVFSHRREH